jgi:hypothetical protein
MVCLIYFSDALGMIHIEPEPPATANDSCHMSRDIFWWETRETFSTIVQGLVSCTGKIHSRQLVIKISRGESRLIWQDRIKDIVLSSLHC